MATYTEVGAYEAKTHLADFLRKVKAGAVIRITQRGEHVADLIPPGSKDKHDRAEAAAQMESFVSSHLPIADVDTRKMIIEGRD